jgi:hypothetical protein
VVNEAEFQTELDNYLENNKAQYYQIDVKYILNSDKALMDTALTELKDGAAFDEVYAKYSTTYDETVESVPTNRLSELGLPAEINASILELQADQYSEVLELTGAATPQYLIFYVTSFTIPPEQETYDSFRQSFTDYGKETMFSGIIDEWIAAAEADKLYERNQKGFDAV